MLVNMIASELDRDEDLKVAHLFSLGPRFFEITYWALSASNLRFHEPLEGGGLEEDIKNWRENEFETKTKKRELGHYICHERQLPSENIGIV
jgi:hypothetical protein